MKTNKYFFRFFHNLAYFFYIHNLNKDKTNPFILSSIILSSFSCIHDLDEYKINPSLVSFIILCSFFYIHDLNEDKTNPSLVSFILPSFLKLRGGSWQQRAHCFGVTRGKVSQAGVGNRSRVLEGMMSPTYFYHPILHPPSSSIYRLLPSPRRSLSVPHYFLLIFITLRACLYLFY